jgi:hypothetical protein
MERRQPRPSKRRALALITTVTTASDAVAAAAVRDYVRSGFDVNTRHPSVVIIGGDHFPRATALYMARVRGHRDTLVELLRAGALDVDLQDLVDEPDSPTTLAAQKLFMRRVRCCVGTTRRHSAVWETLSLLPVTMSGACLGPSVTLPFLSSVRVVPVPSAQPCVHACLVQEFGGLRSDWTRACVSLSRGRAECRVRGAGAGTPATALPSVALRSWQRLTALEGSVVPAEDAAPLALVPLSQAGIIATFLDPVAPIDADGEGGFF